jgi:cis-3-alkyl-4-acyloxetan-2-one decarboxylase
LVEIDGGRRVHVMEQGEGRPVVMFHGNPTWGYLWRKVAAELTTEPFRLVMPDLCGLGFSDRVPDGEFSLTNHGRWMGEVVAALGLSDVIAVVQDWGGPVGLLAMSHNAGAMTGLVVLNTSIGPPKPGFKPTTFHRVFSTRFGGWIEARFGILEKNLGRAQHDRSSISGDVRDSYVYPLRELGNGAATDFARMVPDTMQHPSVPVLEEVSRIAEAFDGPAAIVWGENDPVLGRLLRRVSRTLPQAEVTSTAAGHFLQEEVPTEIADAVRKVSTLS